MFIDHPTVQSGLVMSLDELDVTGDMWFFGQPTAYKNLFKPSNLFQSQSKPQIYQWYKNGRLLSHWSKYEEEEKKAEFSEKNIFWVNQQPTEIFLRPQFFSSNSI